MASENELVVKGNATTLEPERVMLKMSDWDLMEREVLRALILAYLS